MFSPKSKSYYFIESLCVFQGNYLVDLLELDSMNIHRSFYNTKFLS